ncbi:MAG: PAS/PAC sensor signal transduction histidine kinase [Parcubacteria group bacterium Gr01-1014_72]|nr:MAG: PAS/PAC sensor signal transduction histidine kinase [Parcubacteria group bacterium Gr01-1014_72]
MRERRSSQDLGPERYALLSRAALNQSETELSKRTEELERLTERLLARERELVKANEELKELDRIKSEFVAVAAHQLRTPLTGIRWSFQALHDLSMGPLDHEQRKVVDDGLRVTLRAVQLVTNLLNVARIEGGRFGFSFRHQLFVPILDALIPRVKEQAEKKGISVSWTMPHTPPEFVFDADSIALVLDNVFDNAVKYTPPGGKVHFTIGEQGDSVLIVITDTGIGIPRTEEQSVFTKFFRASNALLFQTFGTGLGLYMAKNVILRHSGSISIETKEGSGTKVTIKLPREGPSRREGV